jgi:hypothetical protein
MRFTSQLRSFVLVILLPVSLYLLLVISFRREIGSFVVAARFLGGAFLPEKNLTMQEGEKWYFENKDALMELQKVVLQNPKILRVEPALSIRYIPNSENFTPEDMTMYNELKEKCISLGIKHINIGRKRRSPSGALFEIAYTLTSSGLSVSGGKSLGIEFLPDASIVSMLYNDPEYILNPLDEENWYLVDYRDGRK